MIRLVALFQLIFLISWVATTSAFTRKMWQQLRAAGWTSYAARSGVKIDFRDLNQFGKHREFYPRSGLRKAIAACFVVLIFEAVGMVGLMVHFDPAAR
jgi:hypothetical protein